MKMIISYIHKISGSVQRALQQSSLKKKVVLPALLNITNTTNTNTIKTSTYK